MEIDPKLERQAIEEALQKYPAMREFQPKLEWRALFQGGAFQLVYGVQPPRNHADAWEFQNSVVKAYKRLSV
jgi:hypothetical protein